MSDNNIGSAIEQLKTTVIDEIRRIEGDVRELKGQFAGVKHVSQATLAIAAVLVALLGWVFVLINEVSSTQAEIEQRLDDLAVSQEAIRDRLNSIDESLAQLTPNQQEGALRIPGIEGSGGASEIAPAAPAPIVRDETAPVPEAREQSVAVAVASAQSLFIVQLLGRSVNLRDAPLGNVVDRVSPEDLELPIRVRALSPDGWVRFIHNGRPVWISKSLVRVSEDSRTLESACESAEGGSKATAASGGVGASCE